ncbi:MAG: hypothetical protein V2I40_00820 [Desulfobacteraceae bacterium]|jgi:hypothetical protein|nr:hypothetical protein [Desulfobacteraceae bacterium]
MKKLTLAFVIMAMLAVNQASAETVAIGTGQMVKSEFIALKAMVEGRRSNIVPMRSTPLVRPERYGMVEMARTDFESLRDKVAGRSAGIDSKMAVKTVPMVNIGTGEMPMDEFIALKNMVEGMDIFRLNRLASLQP